MTIWVATGNRHKVKELTAIFAGHCIKTPEDAGILDFNPLENGKTFQENAFLKARALKKLLAFRNIAGPVLADDSGLCVDALGGRPGIYSARYTGRHAGAGKEAGGGRLGSQERNVLLLEEAEGATDRKARFVCAMVLLWEENRFALVEETLEGELVRDMQEAAGEGGFGYDPLLYLPALGCTVAQLPEAEKNNLSHRAKAGKLLARLLTGD